MLRKQIQNKHETEVTKLIKDVTSGNLRKKAARRELNGKGFDIDSEEDDEELLRKIRNKHATALVLDDMDDEDKTPLQRLGELIPSVHYIKKSYLILICCK